MRLHATYTATCTYSLGVHAAHASTYNCNYIHRPHPQGHGTGWPGQGGPFSPLFPETAAPRLS